MSDLKDSTKSVPFDEPKPEEKIRKSEKSRRASSMAASSMKKKAEEAASVSEFVKNTRLSIQLQIASLMTSLELLDSLAEMKDDEKLELLFSLLDKDGDGHVDAAELADGIRKRNADFSFAESLDRAIDMVALFDEDKNAKLDPNEFKNCIDTLLEALGTTFHEFAEFLIFQMVFLEGNDIVEEITSEIVKPEIEQEVRDRGDYYSALVDPRMVALFQLFDLDHDGSVDFPEVVLGLYTLTGDMEASEVAAVDVLLMFDEDDNRTLEYPEFAKLIMNIAAAADTKFEDIADDLTLALCQEKMVSRDQVEHLIVADELFNEAMDAADEIKDVIEAAGALEYTRLRKLFELWDANHDGFITFEELVVAMRKFHGALGIEESVQRAALVMLGFDENGDQKLDPAEFALAFCQYAKSVDVPVSDLVDFMCVVSTLGDNDENEEAYLKAIAPDVTTEIGKIQKKLAVAAITE